jgi:hypothetical protein
MKKILTIILLFVSLIASATNYYVKNSGSDAAAGTSDGTAWKTINKVNASSFSAGDTIFFNKGDLWRESLVVPSASVVVSSYGTGDKPIIDGSDIVSTWAADDASVESGGVFVSGLENEIAAFTTEWTTKAEASSNTVTVSTAVKNNGAKSMVVTWAGSGSGASVYKDLANQTQMNYRFYFYLASGFAMSQNAAEMDVAMIYDQDWGGLITLFLCSDAASTTQFHFRLQLDRPSNANVYTGTNNSISTGTWHYVEMIYKKNSSTGGWELKIDGSSVGSAYNLNTNSYNPDRVYLGDINSGAGVGRPTAGKVAYFDDIKVDVSAIGAFSASGVANVYNSTIAAVPKIVFRDDIPSQIGTSKAALNDHEWIASGNILSYRDDSGTPQGAGYVITAGVRGNAITIAQDYITIDGLNLRKTNACGIYGGTSKHNVYKNNIIDYTVDKGVYLNAWTGSPITANTIQNNSFNHNQGYGINLYGKDDIVSGNTILNMGDYYGSVIVAHAYTAGIDIEPTQNTPVAANTQIFNNYIDGLDGDGSHQSSHGIYIQYQLTGINIYGNTISNIREGDGIKFAGSGSVHHNMLYNNYFAGVGTHSYTSAVTVSIYNNLIFNNGYGVQQNDQIGTLSLSIYNNTFYKNGINSPTSDNSEVYIHDVLTSLIIKNNIFYASNSQLAYSYQAHATTFQSDYNIFYRENAGNVITDIGTSRTFAVWQGLGYDTHSLNSNPLLTSDYHLQDTSPAKDAGTDVSLTTDYAGHPIPYNLIPDIGAYEYGIRFLKIGNKLQTSNGKLLIIKQ